MYSIKTIILDTLSCGDLRPVLAHALNANVDDFNWIFSPDLLRQATTLPTNIIVYGYDSYTIKCSIESANLMKFAREYNAMSKGASLIQFDILSGLERGRTSSIFKQRPQQFAFRGDPHLWNELEKSFGGIEFPRNEEDLVELIHTQMRELTGTSTEFAEDFFVERYATGGMSSGMVNCEFWERRAIPLLLGRFRNLKL